MKIVDEREIQKQTNKDRKEQGETEAIVHGWELNDFVVHFTFIEASFSQFSIV